MRIIKGLVSYSSYGFPLKRLLWICVIYLFFIIGISCERNESESYLQNANIGTASGNGEVEPMSVSPALGNLYLENFNDPSKNQLVKLLCDDSYKSLVFQFYKLKNGRLTLVAFASKPNGKDFNPYFHILKWVDDTIVQDIDDKEVFLGDQRLDISGDFKMLKEAVNKGSVNDSSKNYIVFTPELKRFSADGNYVIEYSFRFTNSLEGFASQILPAGAGRLHPSPPY